MRQLDELSKDELIALLTRQQLPGIRLSFPGRDTARTLARKVRPRVTRHIKACSCGEPEEQSRNLVIEGDNLQAMATLYGQRGRIDMILADPPYNTGYDWRYNDKWDTDPNDPGIGNWVGLDEPGRHSIWMKFMYSRLQLMRSMLKPSGVLAICIDHRELFRLGQMLDEIFGEQNRLAIINWRKASALKNTSNHVSSSTEYVLVYAKDEDRASTLALSRDSSRPSRYSNPDDDPRGPWREGMLAAREMRQKNFYAIQSPFTGEHSYPPGNSHWRHVKSDITRWLEDWGVSYEERDIGDGRAPALMLAGGFSQHTRDKALEKLETGPWPYIWFGRKGDGIARKKIYLEEIKSGRVPETYWSDEDLSADDQLGDMLPDELGSASWTNSESGRSSDGVAELTAIVGNDHLFETVKPLKLFKKLISIWCPPNGTVLDPFAGSGTTGDAILRLNYETNSDRRFILIEQGRPDRGDSYARALLSDRLRRVLLGRWANGKGAPIPGGFRFVQLTKKVDAESVLLMEREEMLDTVIGSHWDNARRRNGGLTSLARLGCRYLIAKNGENEGFYLVWGGSGENTNLTESVYEEIADEAAAAGLARTYHVYARLYVFQTDNVTFYQIPDRILSDFGLNMSSEPFHEGDA